MILSVVCPAHMDRFPAAIMGQIDEQAKRANISNGSPVVEFICLLDNGPLSTGEKMNRLYEMANGDYVSAVGDDDLVSPDYVATLVRAIVENPGVDIVSFDHTYYVNGEFNALTAVSKDFKDAQTEGLHHRCPTPKCAIRREICLKFRCPDISDKEDQSMSEWLVGRLHSEVRIERPIYTHTWNRENKKWRQGQSKMWRRG